MTEVLNRSAGGYGKPRLLWIGDGAVETGLARVTHSFLDRLCKYWDVHLIAVNFNGDQTYPPRWPYAVYPAAMGKNDPVGKIRYPELCARIQPHVSVMFGDPWVLEAYLDRNGGVPTVEVGMTLLDGPNLKPRTARMLSALTLCGFATKFAEKEAKEAGFFGDSFVLGYGVDRSMYFPVDKEESRARIGMTIPKGDFVVGNVNRNQPRKRLDLTVRLFAEWYHMRKPPAWLYLHCANDDIGWDLRQLAKYYKVGERLLMPRLSPVERVPQEQMRLIYSALDLQVSTTFGEGFGLTHLEGMACGIPQLLPEWSALPEWIGEAARFIPCMSTMAHKDINTIGGLVYEWAFVHAMDELFEERDKLRMYGERAFKLAESPQFSWDLLTDELDGHLRRVSGIDWGREAA